MMSDTREMVTAMPMSTVLTLLKRSVQSNSGSLSVGIHWCACFIKQKWMTKTEKLRLLSERTVKLVDVAEKILATTFALAARDEMGREFFPFL